MRLFSAETRKTTGCDLLRWVFCLCVVFIAVGTPIAARAVTVTTTIKVCIKGDANPADTTPLRIVLLGTTASVDTTRADERGCYSSKKQPLDDSKQIVAVATKNNQAAASVLVLKNGETTATLTLSGGDNVKKTVVTICANDKNNNAVPIEEFSLHAGEQNVQQGPGAGDGCVRAQLSADAAKEYQARLIIRSSPASGSQMFALPRLPFIMVALILLLTLLTLLSLLSMRRTLGSAVGPPRRADIQQDMRRMASAIIDIGNRIDKLKASPLPVDTDERTVTYESGKTVETEDNRAVETQQKPSQETERAVEVPPQKSPVPVASSDRRLAEAQWKYSEYLDGKQVAHLSLMPLGDSSASQFDAQAKVKLREQSQGTYVAFLSDGSGTEAWVFPRPGLHFTPERFNLVFPDLLEHNYRSGNVKPKRAVNTEPKMWRIE